MPRKPLPIGVSSLDSWKWGLLPMGLAVALRFYRLGFQSLWYDEAVTLIIAIQELADIPFHMDNHPPLFPMLVRISTLLIDNSEWAVRLPSAVLGSAAVILGYFVVRKWMGGRAAFWTTLLWAVLPFHIFYSQETRMYSLCAFLGLASVYFLDRAQETEAWRDWLAYSAVTVAGFYTHYWFFFLAAGQLLWFSQCVLRGENRRVGGYTAYLAAAICFLPWLPILKTQLSAPLGLNTRSVLFNLKVTAQAFAGTYQGDPVSVEPDAFVVWVSLVAWLVLFAGGLVFAKKDRRFLRLLAGSVLFPAVLILAVVNFKPVYSPRYLSPFLPAIYIVMAPVFESPIVWRRRVAMVLAGIVVASSLVMLNLYYSMPVKGPWRVLNQCVKDNVAPDLKPALVWVDIPEPIRPPSNLYFPQLPIVPSIDQLAPEMKAAILAGPLEAVQRELPKLPKGWTVGNTCEYVGFGAVTVVNGSFKDSK